MSKTIKVLHVISNFGVGGAEVWLIALLRHFKTSAEKNGLKIQMDVFLTNGVRDRLDDEAESLGARLIYARYSRKTLVQFIAKWRRTLKEGEYDAIHDHQEFSAGYHFFFGLGHLPPVRIAHLHNPMSHQVSYANGLLRRQTIKTGNAMVAKYATHLLSTSRLLITQQGYDDLPAARNLPKIALHCGFDPSSFKGGRDQARQEVCSELGLRSGTNIMLFVGRLDSNVDDALNQKNPSFCLEVAKACTERDPDFICLIAGGGDAMLEILRERVRVWGLESRVRLLGARTDVPNLMRAADLLLFPSLAEGLGMVSVEAQAAGLRVLASSAVPRECMVVDGMVDFLPLSDGVDAWTDAVAEKITAPKHDHGAANQLIADSAFSIANSAEKLTEIYSGNA